MIRIFIDGAANPSKLTSAIGVLILEDGQQFQESVQLPEYHDNHETEIYAFIHALSLLLEDGKQETFIFCHTDSKMLVDAIDKNYSKKESHRILLEKANQLLAQFPHFHLKWIPESKNKGADQLARQALYKNIK